MNKPSKRLRRFHLAMFFALAIFIIMVMTMLLMVMGVLTLSRMGLTTLIPSGKSALLIFAVVSIIIGTVLAMAFSRIPLAPMREIMTATERLAKGDFNARINLQGPYELQNLNTSFNHMAEELGSLETLRMDFVNNFSHEFKTPIVSVRGFAKMLKYEDLTKEERDEYLDIIISESERLADLATNVLNLSKVENQSILTDKTLYNGSEQIRRAIALLQSRWMEKHIDIHFDCDEVAFYGNMELLGQVWTNLIDNAIKFSPERASIDIDIAKGPADVMVTIRDQGPGMSAKTLAHIFDKFYQGDTSHATKGNGIGLTLAKKIVELHEGKIFVASDGGATVFEVTLPLA